MDPVTLATTVVGLLVPFFLHEAAVGFAERVGERVADAAQNTVGRLFRTLKTRLHPGSYESGQLEALEAKPDSPARQQALAGVLAEYLGEHEDLAAELEQLVTKAQEAGARVQAIESGITAGGNIKLRAGGDITGRDRIGGSAQDRNSKAGQ